MTFIVCGTDFSAGAAGAARAAGAIAGRLALPLALVHATELTGAALEPFRARLDAQAEELRARFAALVEPRLETGAADEALVALAGRPGARLVVVGALGARRQQRWLLGSVAERVAQASPVPVLVVRAGAGLEAWARGERPLRVMVGVDRGPEAKAALGWARGLRAIGPCDLVVAQIVWPAREHLRAGIAAPIPLDHLRPELEQALRRELAEWAGEAPGAGATSLVVRAGWGRVDGHLAQLAAEREVDLLAVGTHQRAGVARLWQGSVSRAVLHLAATNVACVPRRP